MTLYVPTAAGKAALLELDKVAWASLAHAYSGAGHDFSAYAVPSDDVPAVLRALFAADAELRVEAQHGILSSIWHQGTVYEATAHVVPFLAAFAADPDTPSRGRIVSCLVLIGASAHSGADPVSRAVQRALSSSRAWLHRAQQAGPARIRDAVRLLLDAEDAPEAADARALLAAARALDDAAAAADDDDDGRKEPRLRRASAERERDALELRDDADAWRALLLARRCVASGLFDVAEQVLAKLVGSPLEPQGLTLSVAALVGAGRHDEARTLALKSARAWLTSSTPGRPRATPSRRVEPAASAGQHGACGCHSCWASCCARKRLRPPPASR